MQYPNSAYWTPYMPISNGNFFQPYQLPSFPYCMTLYPNFQNEYKHLHFLPHLISEPCSQSAHPAFNSADIPRNDSQVENQEQKMDETIKKARTLKKKPQQHKDHRILRQCLQPTKHDRNIQSNALKLFLKYMRNDSKFFYSPVRKIITKKNLNYSPEEFVEDLNNAIDPTLNYIRPIQIKEICESLQKLNFSLVFRICLKQFFSRQIHMISTKPIRTNRYVRGQQIKAGRKMIDSLFNS